MIEYMVNKKFFLVFLILLLSIALLALLSGFASAGCCVGTGIGSGCELDSQGTCTLGTYTPLSCSVACPQGCCCPFGSSNGIGATNYSCPVQSTFLQDSDIDGLGLPCSCVGETHSVSGRVTTQKGGAVIIGASVSAGGQSTVSDIDGTYTLTGVPEGSSVLISAEKTSAGCPPNSVLVDLYSDQSGVDISLYCTCNPGTCDAGNDAYCTVDGSPVFYDLTNSDDLDAYCYLCTSYDPDDCGAAPLCIDNDQKCPVGCTPSTDSDCECSGTTSDGICPSMFCSSSPGPNYDVDCVAPGECGDGDVTYPFETCEATPNPGQINLCDAADCVNCNCVGLSGCGNFILEPSLGEECELGTICSDGTPCVNCRCGSTSCSQNDMSLTFSASFDMQDRSIFLSWELPAICPESTYSLYRCIVADDCDCKNKQTGRFSLVYSGADLDWYDRPVVFSSEYCYYIGARSFYRINGEYYTGESEIICETTGDPQCMNNQGGEFCVDNFRSRCEDNNQINQFEDCGSGYCMGPDQNGLTQCLSMGVCDLCNGLYGMFANLNDLKIEVDGREYFCHPGAFRRTVAGCYLDRTKTLFSAFDYCGYLVGCYDYKSEDACTQDMCDIKGCEWIWLDNRNHELGGICRPSDPQLQQCALCDDKEYNWLSPGCSMRVCDLFGEECTYQGKASLTPCTSQSTVKCYDYSTESECIGGRAVSVDANYDNNGQRTGGTHYTVPSNDALGLGKCYWDATNSWCLRNADNYPENNIGAYGDDCNIGDDTCESDFSNPQTQIVDLCHGMQPCSGDVWIGFKVTDDKYAGTDIKTYFKLVPFGQSCYPTERIIGGVYEELVPASGDYTVCFYSEDYAKNLEEIQSITIEVDATPPVIQVTSPSESEFPTSQTSVAVRGVASLDTSNICTYISGSSAKSCINNCLLTGGVAPCIDETTGDFDIVVTVPAQDALYNILFDAADFSGNEVKGWSLLAIYHNESPLLAPVIIIEESPVS